MQVFLLDVEEELGVKGAEVAGDEGVLAVSVVPDDLVGEGPRVAHVAADGEEVAVDEPSLPLLEDCAEEFQHLSADQLVITVHD